MATVLVLLTAALWAQPFTARYLMAFHTCEGQACRDPQNHTVRLAESEDAVEWKPFAGGFRGSVPDVIVRGATLYVFTPGRVTRYRHFGQRWEEAAPVAVRDAEGRVTPFVDPSPVLDDHGRLALFYLVGNTDPAAGDPAGCRSYPCTKYFGSAVEVAGSDGREFVQMPGWRAEVVLQRGTIADPDIFFDGSRWVLYLSAGANTWAYVGDTLHGAYRPALGLPDGVLTTAGGVPSGHFEEETGRYWTFLHSLRQGVSVIFRAEHERLEPVPPSAFRPVIEMGATSVESPGFARNGFRVSLSAASLLDRLAPGGLAAVLVDGALKNVTRVRLRDASGLEFFVPVEEADESRLTYPLPEELEPGRIAVSLEDDAGRVLAAHKATIRRGAPAIYTKSRDGQGLAEGLLVRVRGEEASYEPLDEIRFGEEGEKLYVTLAVTGTHKVSLAHLHAGGRILPAEYVDGGQVNVLLSSDLAGAGKLDVWLEADGEVSNIVQLVFAE
ncbi:MAG: hypothetical protein HY235_08455 [Acidobacteria bacterium]|nr:hypothetical protein [Acidobacteriota bacterium]